MVEQMKETVKHLYLLHCPDDERERLADEYVKLVYRDASSPAKT